LKDFVEHKDDGEDKDRKKKDVKKLFQDISVDNFHNDYNISSNQENTKKLHDFDEIVKGYVFLPVCFKNFII